MFPFPAASTRKEWLAIFTVLCIVCTNGSGPVHGQQTGKASSRDEKLSAAYGWPVHPTYYESAG